MAIITRHRKSNRVFQLVMIEKLGGVNSFNKIALIALDATKMTTRIYLFVYGFIHALNFSNSVFSGATPSYSDLSFRTSTSSNGFTLPCPCLISSSLIFSLSALRKPYSNFPNAGAAANFGYICNAARFNGSSAFHNSFPIIHSSLTTIGPTGNHWFGPFALAKTSYLIPPLASKSSNLLIISKSFAVGGGGGGGAPVFGFLCLGFCGLYFFFLLLLSFKSGAFALLTTRSDDFLLVVVFTLIVVIFIEDETEEEEEEEDNEHESLLEGAKLLVVEEVKDDDKRAVARIIMI